MKSKWALALSLVSGIFAAQHWQSAAPGYRYEFPRDHFSHPEYQTEWWYYTGNLRTANGHRFGFELTFFREAMPLSAAADSSEVWRPDQIYLAHLALSDIDGEDFYHTERINRAGPGLAGVSLEQRRYWNGNWQVRWNPGTGEQQELRAVCDHFSLNLRLNPEKPLVIHGQDGISRKGAAPADASHYISFTRLHAAGKLQWKGRAFDLSGLAWTDHEFFSPLQDNTRAGWDWFAIQLNNNEELMFYRLRRTSGALDPFSSGTYVDSHGQAHFLAAHDFSLTPGETWLSRLSEARYPVGWTISVPSLELQLTERTSLPNQELFSSIGPSPTYWEGAVTYRGHIHAQPVEGLGYLEMTGYAKSSAPGIFQSAGSK